MEAKGRKWGAPPLHRAPEKGRRSTSRNIEERRLDQGHLLRHPSLRRGRPEGLGGRRARRPPSPPPKPIAQRGCPILCSLPAGDPRSVWPAAPGIPSLLEHRPLRCKPLVPPSQFDPAEYDVIPHGAKSLGHGYRGFTSP